MKQALIKESLPLSLINHHDLRRQWKRDVKIYLILVPGIVYFLLFKYAPMWSIVLAFKNYKPAMGFSNSAWVGLTNFTKFFNGRDFSTLLANTLRLAINNILLFFPLPIVFALILHELSNRRFKRVVQSVIYVPHFISWVVVIVITQQVFGATGLVNGFVEKLGGSTIPFLYSKNWFRPIVLFQTMWKESGWGTIIFIAALTAVNQDLYEAATIDGANRIQKLIHITLPGIRSTIIVMFILRVGRFLDTGFEQIFLLLNASNREVGQVFDTFSYEMAILQGRFSYGITVSIFKSVVGLLLVLVTDYLAKKSGEEGIL